MNSRAVMEVVEIAVAVAAGVALMDWWVREFRKSRQS